MDNPKPKPIKNPTKRERIFSNKDEPPGIHYDDLFAPSEYPAWLLPPKDTYDRSELYYENTWHTILERLASGETIKNITEDINMPDYGKLLKWIHQDKEREAQYELAKQIFLESRMDDHYDDLENPMDENGIPKDIQWIKEKIGLTKFLATAWNKKRYGKDESKQNINVNLGSLTLDALRKRNTDDSAPIDVTPTNDPLEHKNG